MKVQLFGLSISTHRRLEQESEGWKDAVPDPHIFSSMPTDTNEHVEFTSGELRELRKTVSEGFTHIVLPASRKWEMVRDNLEFNCRLHVARLWEPVRDVPWEVLRDRLHQAVKVDEEWLSKIAPKDLRHALLLPPKVFATMVKTHEYWKKCDVYSAVRVPSAEAILNLVEKEHRKPDSSGGHSWIDDRKLRFKFDPSKHGLSVAARAGKKEFRFCYEVAPGFHYDVSKDGGKTFVMNIDGKQVSICHCNITPWGHIRKSG